MNTSSRSKHIVFLLDYFHPRVGGHEYLFFHLAKGLSLEGYKVSVITSCYKKGLPKYEKMPVDSVSESCHLEIHRVRGGRYAFGLCEPRRILRIIKKADIVHSSTIMSAFPAWTWAKVCSKKIILTVHEVFGRHAFTIWGIGGILLYLYEKVLFLLPFDHVIAVSDHTLTRIPKKYHARRIYNGITSTNGLHAWSPSGCDTIKIGYFGRDGKTKGVRQILPYVQKWMERNQNFEFDFYVGRKDSSKKYDSVRFLEHVSEEKLEQTMLTYDAIIVPSISEGFGLTAVLACTLGIPVICSNAGALQEVVFGKVVFFDPYCSLSLFRALGRVKEGDYSHIDERQFSFDQTVRDYMRIYE